MSLASFVENFPAIAALAAGLVTAGYVIVRGRAGASSRQRTCALKADEFQQFKLTEKIEISHDTRLFRFALHHANQQLGLPIGQHITVRAVIDGKDVQRSYTPVSGDEDLGHFDLLIKVYYAGVHPKFPEGGKLSQYMDRLKIGNSIDVKGPIGRFEYLGNGAFRIKKGKDEYSHHTVRALGMIAGGTGITPMRQLIVQILKNPNDQTTIHLLFANQTEADILLREELEGYTKDPRFKLWYTLDRPDEATWKYSKGFVDYDMVKHHMPAASPDAFIVMCGPLPMINFACKPNLEKAGFSESQFFAF